MPIKIVDFGGLVPKAQPRALPDNAAQTATNLHPGTREFRPLAADTTVVSASGVTDPATIWRFQRKADGSLNTDFTDAAAWRALAIPTSHAKVPLNDDLTDRHVATTDDGSFAPRVFDATGDVRLLGVPAPSTAPTVVVNSSDEFTPEDRNAGLEEVRNTVVSIVRSNATPVWRGATAPGTGTTGYLDRSTANGFAVEDARQQVRMYRLSGAGGTISDAYAVPDDALFSWIFDPLVPSFEHTTSGTPAWAGSNVHLAIPFTAYGITYDIDTAAITTAVAAIEQPGTTDGTKMFSADEITALTTALTDHVDPTGTVVKAKVDALASAVATLTEILDGGGRASLAAQTQAFYSKTDVAAEITQIIANAADIVFNMADGIARSSLPDDYGNQGNQP